MRGLRRGGARRARARTSRCCVADRGAVLQLVYLRLRAHRRGVLLLLQLQRMQASAAIASSSTVHSGTVPLEGMHILTEANARSVVEPAWCHPPHPPLSGSTSHTAQPPSSHENTAWERALQHSIDQKKDGQRLHWKEKKNYSDVLFFIVWTGLVQDRRTRAMRKG